MRAFGRVIRYGRDIVATGYRGLSPCSSGVFSSFICFTARKIAKPIIKSSTARRKTPLLRCWDSKTSPFWNVPKPSGFVIRESQRFHTVLCRHVTIQKQIIQATRSSKVRKLWGPSQESHRDDISCSGPTPSSGILVGHSDQSSVEQSDFGSP